MYLFLQVIVEDIQGRINEISQPFSLDNSKPSLKFFSQWPLSVYFPDVVSKCIIFPFIYFKLVILNYIYINIILKLMIYFLEYS